MVWNVGLRRFVREKHLFDCFPSHCRNWRGLQTSDFVLRTTRLSAAVRSCPCRRVGRAPPSIRAFLCRAYAYRVPVHSVVFFYFNLSSFMCEYHRVFLIPVGTAISWFRSCPVETLTGCMVRTFHEVLTTVVIAKISKSIEMMQTPQRALKDKFVHLLVVVVFGGHLRARRVTNEFFCRFSLLLLWRGQLVMTNRFCGWEPSKFKDSLIAEGYLGVHLALVLMLILQLYTTLQWI